ncbi:alpha/beta hydrolase [Nocardia brasiliensis]|uniref:alpha/beta hydrolase n=1 Tax=Nocardia brasiliensis TaxID=37326 RepID=UPI003670C233
METLNETGIWDSAGPVRFDDTETFLFRSADLDVPLDISVARPTGPGGRDGPLPVLYVLDPFLWLPLVVHVSRALTWFTGFPPTLVVGIGHPTTDHIDYFALRARDFSPVEGELPPSISPIPLHRGTGHADRFLDVLAARVFPGIEERYGADPSDRTILGWSFSGLFGLHALFTQPELFDRYLIVSPSLPWGGYALFDTERRYAQTHSDLPKDLFLVAGTHEDSVEAARDGWIMVPLVQRLFDTLTRRGYPSLRPDTLWVEGMEHTTAGWSGVAPGLRFLFDRH